MSGFTFFFKQKKLLFICKTCLNRYRYIVICLLKKQKLFQKYLWLTPLLKLFPRKGYFNIAIADIIAKFVLHGA